MTTKQQVTSALIRYQPKLADLWKVSEAEVSRRLSGERNIPLEDILNAFEALEFQIVTDPDLRCVHKDELKALNLLSGRYLHRRINGEQV